MRYLSGMFALNTPCQLNTTGDWHRLCFDWSKPEFRESNGSFFGDFGIEVNAPVPMLGTACNKANHIRAILDLLCDNRLMDAQGMNHDFICVDEYNDLVFQKVASMRVLPNWSDICTFMIHEYGIVWVRYLKKVGIPIDDTGTWHINKL